MTPGLQMREEYGVRKVVAYLLLLFGVPNLMLAEDIGWPREVIQNGARIVYYQPQIDKWVDYKTLDARMAISVTPAGGKATPGVVSIEARTDADKETRTVVISDIKLTDARFPSADVAGAEQLGGLVRELFKPDNPITISLDRLTAEAEEDKIPGRVVQLDNTPPKIFVSRGPAVLLLVDDKEVLVPIEKTKLQFVVNANWPVLFDTEGKKYYLLNGKQWLTASKLEGPWTATTVLAKEMSTLPADENWAEIKKSIPPQGAAGATPKVFYSNVPAEVIEFTGAPVYAKIPGTQLTYATNTKSSVYVQTAEQKYYFLVSGRWFRSSSLDGPWTYASEDLPGDFAKIPPNGPGSSVLASVPGTEQANDAVLLAQIPTTAVVNIPEAEAQVKVHYDGDPQFKPIETTTLSYATNTQDKVIKFGDIYYLCFQAVWFMSTTATGPWKVASSVPKEIYTIPPSSPVYNVTYVTQVQTSPTTVECDQTAGYLGMFLVGAAVGLTIAYGTGYYYPPYYYYPVHGYPIYRPYPVTYGVGAFYSSSSGAYGVARGAYGPYGGVTGAAWYNPSTGRYGRSVSAYGPYGSMTAARTYNPYTGVYGATRQGSNAYGNWGSSVAVRGDQWAQTAHKTTGAGTAAGFRTSEGARGAGFSGANGNSGFVAQGKNDNMYAGKNGDVYRKDSSGNWQQYDNGSWTDAGPKPTPHGANADRTQGARAGQLPAQGGGGRGGAGAAQQPTIPSGTLQQLNRDAEARQTGAQRTQQFQRSQGGGRTRSSGGGRRRAQ
jgi:hypothetical protein